MQVIGGEKKIQIIGKVSTVLHWRLYLRLKWLRETMEGFITMFADMDTGQTL